MATESINISQSSSKRKVKNKMPKRLRHKNKPNDVNVAENVNITSPKMDETETKKQNSIQKSDLIPLNTSSSKTIDNSVVLSMTETSLDYWKLCTKNALNILEKQAYNRRKHLIERHQERIDSIQCLLRQHEHINKLNEEHRSMSQLIDSLRSEINIKDETLKNLQEKLHEHDDLIHNNESLRIQFQSMEYKLQRITIEYSKKMEENHQNQIEYEEQIQSLMDEIERIKRDLVLEEYRKQEAERKVRCCDEKLKIEQNLNKKAQQDVVQLKQELKSMHARYDSLQIEMLAMHKANNDDLSFLPTNDTTKNEWSNHHTINHDSHEHLEIKRSKRKSRDRTESLASRTSNTSDKRNKIMKKSSSQNKENEIHDPSLILKRKPLKSKKSNKNLLPIITLTHASPSNDQSALTENDSTQLLIPSSIGTTSENNASASDSHDTSYESHIVKPQTKKQSRYPCRRAQRPVKHIDTSVQI